MRLLPAIASTGFSWFYLQKAGKRRAGSDWQTGFLFQSQSSHRLWTDFAALSGFEGTVLASCGPLCGEVCVIADNGHDHSIRLSTGNRRRQLTQCLSVVESIMRAVEFLPQFVPSTTVTGHRSEHCNESAFAKGVIDIDIRGTAGAVWTAALCGLSGAIATIVSVVRSWRRRASLSLIPIVFADARELIFPTLPAQQVLSLEDFEDNG